MIDLKEKWGIHVFGGCCGSDSKHMIAIADRIFQLK